MQIIHWLVFTCTYAYLMRLSGVTKPSIWPLPLQSIRPQLPYLLTDLDETGIKIHGLLRSFI